MSDNLAITPLLRQLAAYRQSAAHEGLRAARYGGERAAPPEIAANLADARANIARLKAALRDLGVAVDDLTGDDGLRLGATPTPADPAHPTLADMPLGDDGPLPAPAPLPPGSRMPIARNPLFVGRAGDLRELARALAGGATTAIAAATGLGGIGKTQLASEFAHRYGQFFAGGVLWLSFADAGAVAAEVAACGGAGGMELPDFESLPFNRQVARVKAAWLEPTPRLLVFDNCEDEALLDAWRPISGGCRVLLTSRRSRWDAGLGVWALPLDVLPRPESIALLRRFRPDLAERDADLNEIAVELGDLPLALHLAGSYLGRYARAVMPAAYLAQLRAPDTQWALLKVDGRSPTGHEQDVARTFLLSYGRLQPAQPTDALATQLLARAAHLAPGEPIPRTLLAATVQLEGEDAALRFEDALARLGELGLIDEEADGALRLHRLICAFARGVVQHDGAQAAVEEALVEATRSLIQQGYPHGLFALQTHLRYATAQASDRMDDAAANLNFELGLYLRLIGDYAGARTCLERVLHIDETLFEPESYDVAADLNNLAGMLDEQGDFAQARQYYERALAICEKVLGSEHPDTATTLNNIGALLVIMGKLPEAAPYIERGLVLCEQALGPEHPSTGISLGNIGALHAAQEQFAEAQAYLERAISILERFLGDDHPDTMKVVESLGMVFYSLGDLALAREYVERALRSRERVLGSNHPDVAYSLNNLGLILMHQGEEAAAQSYFERALVINEAILRPNHPFLAKILANLGAMLLAQADLAGARQCLERAFSIAEQFPDASDATLVKLLNALGLLQLYERNPAGARSILERACALSERVHGPTSTTTAESLHSFGLLLASQGDKAEARSFLERALAIYTDRCDPRHPSISAIQSALAQLEP